jgi:type IV pilus assembly protein PilY1
VVNFIRGADVLDEDEDGVTTENRAVITGDILHSEPAVVSYNNSYLTDSVVFFGSNDGMLHAVLDADGTEMWGFIPSDLLSKLKDILEGSNHSYFVDASPKVHILNGNDDNVVSDGEQAILVFGERSGGYYYYALDITNPNSPSFLWKINSLDGVSFGETWSEPVFTKVRISDGDTTGTDVMMVGGGYSVDNSLGNFVAAVNLLDGSLVAMSNPIDLDFSIPSSVLVVDLDNNKFVDKVYVGDMGGQLIRFGCFTDVDGTLFEFPETNENINKWYTSVIFDTDDSRKFFYPPSVTLEKDFDLVFIGSGNRNDACSTASSDRIYAIKDDHTEFARVDTDLVNITDPMATPPVFPDANGYYLGLSAGEKILSKGMVFNKVYYVSSFTPDNSDPCMPGGISRLYALGYKTGEAQIDFDGDGTYDRYTEVGGGIPSKPVMIIPAEGKPKLLISVGSTVPDPLSPEVTAGIAEIDPLLPARNFFYLWWTDLN